MELYDVQVSRTDDAHDTLPVVNFRIAIDPAENEVSVKTQHGLAWISFMDMMVIIEAIKRVVHQHALAGFVEELSGKLEEGKTWEQIADEWHDNPSSADGVGDGSLPF